MAVVSRVISINGKKGKRARKKLPSAERAQQAYVKALVEWVRAYRASLRRVS